MSPRESTPDHTAPAWGTSPESEPHQGPGPGSDAGAGLSAPMLRLVHEPGSGTGPDTGPDAEPDTGPDSEPDTGSDAGPDTGSSGVARVVLSGTIVDPDTGTDSDAGSGRGLVGGLARSGGVVVGRVVDLVRHERTRAVAMSSVRVVVRHAAFILAGVGVLARRVWDARTTSRLDRMMRTAESSGDALAVAQWQYRAELFKADRHERIMTWLNAPVVIAKGLIVTGITAPVVLLALGAVMAATRHDSGLFLAPMIATGQAITTTIAFTQWVVPKIVMVIPWVVLGVLWHQGRTRAAMPTWLATAAEADVDVSIDENTIARALGALRIPQITAHLKAGPLQFITPARRDGRGTHAVLRLPAGVSAVRIAQRRRDLSTGLYRRAGEVWPTVGAEEGILDLWIADKGALADGAGPYPLLVEGTVDVFKSVPFGRTLRGEPVNAPIMGRNTITGGMPEQGKSSAARVIMAGAALDPTVELRVWVPDANFDFDAFQPRCSSFIVGAEDEKIERILQELRDLIEEIQRRGDLLIRYQVAAVTRELASKGVGLHPLLCLLEEAHVVFTHPVYGPEAQDLATQVVKLGRKRGIHLIISTQAPTAKSVPKDLTRNCTNGIAFAVGDHVANDGLLGDGAHKSGHRATELMPGTDRGTAVVKGFAGASRSQTVQVYFIGVDRGHDQITPIITRALAAIAERGTGIPGAHTPRAEPITRDLLEDLAEVLDENTPTPIADVPALLARAWPTWGPYRGLTGKALRAVLDAEHGVKVPSTGNRYPLDPVTIRDAIARRDTPDGDTDTDDTDE